MAFHNRYRPQRLKDIFGQDHVVRTLKNAAKSGRLKEYQAVLFIGTRGSGKTSCARILAHLVNCTNPKDGEPCYKCSACKAVTASLECGGDVYEMDAASHGGVADVERLIDACHYQPIGFDKRVFIIDEAHQLSPQAKDALLKTLEEPPSHVMFILATTEAHKIPLTISSRCIQFQFVDGSIKSICDYLESVLKHRSTTYEKPALQRIAVLASGSYREAISLVEKVVDTSGSVTTDSLDETLCLPGAELLASALKACLTGDKAKCISTISSAIEQGKDTRLFLREIVQKILRGATKMAEDGVDRSPEGLSIDNALSIGEYIFSKSTSYASELTGYVPGLILAGAADMARQYREESR